MEKLTAFLRLSKELNLIQLVLIYYRTVMHKCKKKFENILKIIVEFIQITIVVKI